MEEERKTELDVDPELQNTPQEQKVDAPPETEKEAGAPAVKKRPRLKLYIIAGLVATMLALSGFAVSLLLRESEKPQVETSQNDEEELLEVEVSTPPKKLQKLNNFSMEPFILSTGKQGSKRFMRIKFSLQLSSNDAIAEIEENLAIMRETVYLFIRNRGAGNFTIPENRVETLNDLKRLLDRSIQNGLVEKVMITELSVY